jgi:Ni/Co efflux regulator RcnB
MSRASRPRHESAPQAAAAAPPSGDVFEHLLHFATLEEAEATLRRVDALWRQARAAGDHAKAAHVLEVAREGRRRAQMIAGNRRVAPEKRTEKAEIRQWFRVWLETPDAFFDWLELRKRSPEFVEKFGPPHAEGEQPAREG